MKSARKFLGVLTAVILAAFALPAVADSGDNYRLDMPAASVSSGTEFSVTITNKARWDYLKSFTLTAPAGVYITSVLSGSSSVPQSKISAPAPTTAGGTISVSNILIPYGQTGKLKIKATFPASCTSQALNWGSSAKGGLIVNNEVFTLENPPSTTNVAGGTCTYSLTGDSTVPAGSTAATVSMTLKNNASASGPAITSLTIVPPTGVTIVSPAGGTFTGLNLAGGASAPISVTVSTPPSCTETAAAFWTSSVAPATFALSGANPKTTIAAQVCSLSISAPTSAARNAAFTVTVGLTGGPGTAAVTLAGSNCGTFTATDNGTGFSRTFNSPAFSSTGSNCTLTATAPDYVQATKVMSVFEQGSLQCAADPNNPPPSAIIDGSAVSGLTVVDPGYAEGVRGPNVKQTSSDCPPVNWTFTNNVLGTSSTTDAKGNTVLPNSVSFVWDQNAQPNAAFTYSVTWQPEWFGIASTSNRKTRFCTNAACTTSSAAQVCLSPALLPSSLPAGEPACISAEVWGVVNPSKCASLPAPATDQTACVVVTTTITDIEDPAIIRN